MNSNSCILCDLTFDSTQEVFRHVKQEHFGMSANEEEDSEIGPSIIDATGTNTKPWEIKPTNTLRNPNPAQGIFANVDFDRLNKRPPNVATKPSKSRPETSTVVANRMLSRALNNQDIPKGKRMSAKDFFDKNEDTFGPAKPKTLISKDYSKKSKSRGSTPEGVSNSGSDDECKLKASVHWSQPLILEEEEEKMHENLMQKYLEDFFQS